MCFALISGCNDEPADSTQGPVSPPDGPLVQIAPSPTGVIAAAANSQVNLSWSSGSGVLSYRIKRSTISGGPFAQVASVSSTAYSDTSVSNGTTFFYVVTAVNEAGESAPSVQVSATPSAPVVAPPPLPAPTGVSATAGTGQVTLSWGVVNGASGYNIKRATESGGPYSQIASQSSTTFNDSSLSPGVTFYYVVSAIYSSGESGNSMQASATPLSLPLGSCDSLPAAGQWQEISPPAMRKSAPYDGAIVTIVDPNSSGTVYVTTARSGIFKSVNCGASWTKINTGRNGDKIDQGLVWSAVLDPVDSKIIYANTGYGPSGLWKSTNGGIDWDNVQPTGLGMPGFVAHVAMDPTDHQHIVMTFHDNCTGGHTPVCFGETKDGGKTWKVLDFPTSLKNGWGEGTFLLPLDSSRWLYLDWELYYTGDAGKTWKQVDTGGAAAIQGAYYRDPAGTYWLASILGVIKSTDGEHWTRVPDSYSQMDTIVGCGKNLFAAVGFQVPQGTDFVYTTNLANPATWSVMPTPGLTRPLVSGATSLACDSAHGVLYVAAQAAGLWRVVVDH